MYPQKWRFPEQILAFTLDYADYNNPQDGNIQLTWDPSTKFRRQSHDQLLETADFFRGEINRLQNHVNVDENMDDIPEHEWDAIRSYHSALITAMSMAVESLPELAPDCFANATNCHVQARMRYDPLAAPSLNTAEATRPYSCDTDVSMDFAQYVIADEVESAYQRITFFQDPVTKDMCFDLDDTYQQCTRYVAWSFFRIFYASIYSCTATHNILSAIDRNIMRWSFITQRDSCQIYGESCL